MKKINLPQTAILTSPNPVMVVCTENRTAAQILLLCHGGHGSTAGRSTDKVEKFGIELTELEGSRFAWDGYSRLCPASAV